jgi:hypothetical protein
MFQFWRCPTNRMTHHPVGPAIADHSLFREPNYPALTRHNAAQRPDMGTYRA